MSPLQVEPPALAVLLKSTPVSCAPAHRVRSQIHRAAQYLHPPMGVAYLKLWKQKSYPSCVWGAASSTWLWFRRIQ
jgi:hypothetical protein